MNINITKASGLNKKLPYFCYYEFFDGEEGMTDSVTDKNPIWDYTKKHEIIYDENFIQKLKTDDLEFTIFDDSADIGEDNVGVAKMNLFSLIVSDNFGGDVAIRD